MIFIKEASERALVIADWKVLSKGEYSADRKGLSQQVPHDNHNPA